MWLLRYMNPNSRLLLFNGLSQFERTSETDLVVGRQDIVSSFGSILVVTGKDLLFLRTSCE